MFICAQIYFEGLYAFNSFKVINNRLMSFIHKYKAGASGVHAAGEVVGRQGNEAAGLSGMRRVFWEWAEQKPL